jgi:hypothetical protein
VLEAHGDGVELDNGAATSSLEAAGLAPLG